MAKTIFEQTGGTYTTQGDYCLPNLTLPPEEERHIGVWAQRRLRYLKQHHKILYCNLLTSGKIHSHLTDVEQEAQTLFLRLVKEYAEQEGLTEHRNDFYIETIELTSRCRNLDSCTCFVF